MPRWAWGLFSALFYLELLVILSLKIHFPTKPDPVFQKPAPTNEYHWTRGPYDNDWDGCWTNDYTGEYICIEEQI